MTIQAMAWDRAVSQPHADDGRRVSSALDGLCSCWCAHLWVFNSLAVAIVEGVRGILDAVERVQALNHEARFAGGKSVNHFGHDQTLEGSLAQAGTRRPSVHWRQVRSLAARHSSRSASEGGRWPQ